MSSISEGEEGQSVQHVGMRRLSEYNNPYINSSNCSCNIHSILSAAVEIGIVIFRQSFHSVVLLTLTGFSFCSSLPCSFTF